MVPIKLIKFSVSVGNMKNKQISAKKRLSDDCQMAIYTTTNFSNLLSLPLPI